MRAFKKKELIEKIKCLDKVNDLFKKQIETKKALQEDILVKCQQSAIDIGTEIEKETGENAAPIYLLEQYCELIYQLSQPDQNDQQSKKIIKKVRNLLTNIINSIQQEIQDSKKEVVFLPYKASMWDSLESVWKAAYDDKEYDTYVIPIPYFDLNSDGSVAQVHYEGNEYPDYVSITSWEDYSIADRRPDIIYIHNPYDEYNLVTQVQPSFYAKELKKHTNMLVYIPYFVCSDDVPKHFCVLPGTIYADKIIVQSDKIKNTYIKEFHELEKEEHCEGLFGKVEEKFLSLGSPKFDKVLNTMCENVEIPENWKKLMIRADGSRKKVIFYNTSLQVLLANEDKYLEKLQSVLNIFQEKCKDFTILWRPHPLSEATLSSVKPHILKRYREILEDFKRAGFGILDETSDLHRSIAISDAFYGDNSSVMTLCEKADIPIMTQTIGVKREYEKGLWFESRVEVKDGVIFSANNFNGLFKKDISGNIEILSKIPGEDAMKIRLFSTIIGFNQKILLTPMTANDFAVYDTVSGEYVKYPVKSPELITKAIYNPYCKFFAAVQYEKYIFSIGCSYPGIVRFDTESNDFLYIDHWVADIDNYVVDENDVYFRQDIVVLNDIAYIALCNGNAILKFNLATLNYEIFPIGNRQDAFAGICFDGENFWLSPRKSGQVLVWNEENGLLDRVDMDRGHFNATTNITFFDGLIWVFQSQGDVYMIDRITHKVEDAGKLNQYTEVNTARSNWPLKYAFAYVENDKLNTFSCYQNECLQISSKLSEIIAEKYSYKIDRLVSYKTQLLLEDNPELLNEILEETTSMGLVDFLCLIAAKEKQINKKIAKTPDATCGKKVHENIKRALNGKVY